MDTTTVTADDKRLRWHYINLDRKEYVVTRSNCNYLVLRHAMKTIGWSSKDTIICFDNGYVLGCELPHLWNEEIDEFSEYFLKTFKNVTERPISFEAYYDNVNGYCIEKWYQFLEKETISVDDD